LIILLFSFLALANSCLQAQLPDYHVQLFDERNGVHTSLMQGIVKDHYDFVWILYRDRIQRYDGKETMEFAQ